MIGERVPRTAVRSARPHPSGSPPARAKSFKSIHAPPISQARFRRGPARLHQHQQLRFPIFRDSSGRSPKNASKRGTAGMLER